MVSEQKFSHGLLVSELGERKKIYFKGFFPRPDLKKKKIIIRRPTDGKRFRISVTIHHFTEKEKLSFLF